MNLIYVCTKCTHNWIKEWNQEDLGDDSEKDEKD